jgi:hypothetical protein
MAVGMPVSQFGEDGMSRTARRLRRTMPRTEAEWLACSDPLTMLEVLRAKASDRKVRLFAVGCCRLTLADSAPAPSRRAVEVAERFADGLAGREELLRARSMAFRAALEFQFKISEELRERGIWDFPRRNVSDEEVRHYFVAEAAHPHRPFGIGLLRHRLRWDHGLTEVAPHVIRDVLGNPFRPSMFDSCWQTRDVADLARAIYDGRDFGRMPDLADALQGAGCDDPEILRHCRGPGPHVRGCWVIDFILGKS